MEALGDVDIGAVDVKPLQLHCSSNVVVPGDMIGDSIMVGTVLDSGSGITCLSEQLSQQMEQHFRGERLVHPCLKEMSVQLANGQKVVVRNQTRTLQGTIGTPWSPGVISTAFAVIPGTGSVLILGSKTLREKLGIDVMSSLKGKAQGGGRSSGDMPEDVGSRGGISLLRVAVTMKGIQAAGKVAAAMEPRDESVEDVVARGPAMFMDVGDEVIASREALMAAVDAALEAGLPSDAETRLRDLLLGPLFDGFRRSLSEGYTGEGGIFPSEPEGGCRFVQGEGKAKGIFTSEDYMVGRAVRTTCRRRNGVREPASDMFKFCPGGSEGQWLPLGW